MYGKNNNYKSIDKYNKIQYGQDLSTIKEVASFDERTQYTYTMTGNKFL